jgi:transglutaminase-like putative cysteine protease
MAPQRWSISHRTTYRYTVAVAFAPHVVRLAPRTDSVLCVRRELWFSPPALDVYHYVDPYGNGCARATFGSERSQVLQVDSHLEVESLVRPPLPHSLPKLPWATPSNDTLAAFRRNDASPAVVALGQQLAMECGSAPLAFFDSLCRWLYTNMDRQLRLEGAAQTPDQTLAIRHGACRDLTVLFLAVCRAFGVAGRFVSGYQGQEMTPDGQRHLHAWPQVWVPNAGWLGWDPTHGVPEGPGHVALCAAPQQADTMPIDGGFYFDGPTVTSTLDYSITFA